MSGYDEKVLEFKSKVKTLSEQEVIKFSSLTELDGLFSAIVSSAKKVDFEDLTKDYNQLKTAVKKSYTQRVTNALDSDDIQTVYKLVAEAVAFDPKNSELFEKIAHKFEKNELYEELIKLYRMMFVYCVKPVYFEYLADLYMKIENYEDAINYYLNYCETVQATSQIYRKLAVAFEKNNDIKSKNSCLEFAKKLEEESE